MNDKLTLILVRTATVVQSIDTLLEHYKDYKDLGDNTYGGYKYNCLLEVKSMALDYQNKQITDYFKTKENETD